MTLLESFRVALEALGANKLRSVLTMLGIIIGVGSVIAIFAIGRGTEAAVRGELTSMASGQVVLFPGGQGPGTATQRIEYFTEQDMRNIENLLPDVEVAVTSYQMQAQIRAGRETQSAQVQGHYAKSAAAFDIKIAEGRWFTKAEEESGARVVVLGQGAVKRLWGEKAQAVGRSVTINGYPFQVIGITENPTGMLASFGLEDNSYYASVVWVRQALRNPPIFQVIIKVKPGANTRQVQDDAIALVERAHSGAKFSGQSMDQFVEVISKVISIVTGVLSAVAGISLVVGGVGIMNIMLVSVTERTREIGIRKALGATFRDVLTQFLIEAVVLSLIGGGIGIALAAGPVWAVGRWLKIALLVDWMSVALALGFSVGVGVLFGVYPASKAARLDPIEALRYE